MIKLNEKELKTVKEKEKYFKMYIGEELTKDYEDILSLTALLAKCLSSDDNQGKKRGKEYISEIENRVKQLVSDVAVFAKSITSIISCHSDNPTEDFEKYSTILTSEMVRLELINRGLFDSKWVESGEERLSQIREQVLNKKAELEADEIRSKFKIV